MDIINSAKSYFDEQLLPAIKEFAAENDFICVIGGSVSYGFADALSDADVYIIWDLPREIWFEKLRKLLFMPKMVNDFRIQYIPLILSDKNNTNLSSLLSKDYQGLKGCSVKQLYDIKHYIPVNDPDGAVNAAQAYINEMGHEYWKTICTEHCLSHIDILEQFYGSLKRNSLTTGLMLYGEALKGLLQIAVLADGGPYPPAKWLLSELERTDYALADKIKQFHGNNLTLSAKTCIQGSLILQP